MSEGPSFVPDNTPAYAPDYPAPYNAPGSEYAFDLNWIVDRLHTNNKGINANRDHIDNADKEIESLKVALADAERRIRNLQAKICHGEFAKQDFLNWADEHLPCIIGNAAQHVFPALTKDGHIVFYFPESWQFLSIDVIMEPDSKCFGHLILTY